MSGKRNLLKGSSISYSRFLTCSPQNDLFNKKSEPLLDIDFFRRSIALHYQHVYNFRKRQNTAYRIIFFGLSMLFFFLFIGIYFKTANYACGLYFGQCDIVKNCVDGSCLLLSAFTFALGYLTHPDKEALRYLVKKVKKELNSPTHQVRIELNMIFKNLVSEHLSFQNSFAMNGS
ncbi:Conserved hypothetical membrane protein [Candidatus Protochlamydia naegleriophila]|uniref:Conserved hypothetical membrane protein n=1 Tax=Candidatus Protochlamydia naegleriophila TaxID=389348 RepID=A0A0U5ES66_9BACT|nr:hypothetical protein [Candidatus Protochlamydia naegleriophila]CUI17043.1 Conserved hypothetical membrane protein [Candidatus Protochlamydia naegleriophila]